MFLVTLSLKCTVFEIFDFKNAVTLKTGLGVRQGHWECTIVPFDRVYDFLLSSIVTMALSRVISSSSKNFVTLKWGSKVTQGH